MYFGIKIPQLTKNSISAAIFSQMTSIVHRNLSSFDGSTLDFSSVALEPQKIFSYNFVTFLKC